MSKGLDIINKYGHKGLHKYWKDKCEMAEGKIRSLKVRNNFLEDKVKFLEGTKSTSRNYGRGKWLKSLKTRRKACRGECKKCGM